MWRLTEGIIISLPALLLHVNDTDVGRPSTRKTGARRSRGGSRCEANKNGPAERWNCRP